MWPWSRCRRSLPGTRKQKYLEVKVCSPELNLVENVCVFCLSRLEAQNLVHLLCLFRMETQDVLHLLSRWTLNVEYLSPHRLEAQNMIVSVVASQAGDSGLGICYCLFPHGPEAQNGGVSVSVPSFTGLGLRTEVDLLLSLSLQVRD